MLRYPTSDPRHFDKRLFKGGGGDPGADARRMEAERQARITAAIDQINHIFNGATKTTKTRTVRGNGSGNRFQMAISPSREETYEEWVNPEGGNPRDALYADQRKAVYDINKLEVDRQAQEAGRANKFGLARSGLAGGSVDVDSTADINRRTNEGLLRAGGIADQSSADLKTADERTRSNLISMAQSGIDTGSAATMALNGLKVNADSVASQRSGASVGGLFNDMSQAYLMNQQNQGRAAGMNPYAGQFLGVSAPQQGNNGTVQ